MCKSLLCAQFILALSINFCMAQSNGMVPPPAWLETNTPKNVNWGEPVHGVQLSMSATNNVIPVGSAAAFIFRIKNASTNTIYLHQSDPLKDVAVDLTSLSGRVIHLTPGRKPSDEYWYNVIRPLKPGEVYKWSLEIGISKDVEPGTYAMKATRDFIIDPNGYSKKKWLVLSCFQHVGRGGRP